VTFVKHPQSLVVNPRSGAIFTVEAVGAPPILYQWLFNGTPIANATTATLSFTNVDTSRVGTYTVVVTTTAGSATSDPATLTLSNAPTRVSNISTRGVTNGGNQALYKAAPSRDKADALVDARLQAPFAGDANDVLYQWDSSRDYDPSAGLEKIRGVLLAINSADDERNPPELGIMERELAKVRGARMLLIPASTETRGHGTTAAGRPGDTLPPAVEAAAACRRPSRVPRGPIAARSSRQPAGPIRAGRGRRAPWDGFPMVAQEHYRNGKGRTVCRSRGREAVYKGVS
jgi:hypothetical protein